MTKRELIEALEALDIEDKADVLFRIDRHVVNVERLSPGRYCDTTSYVELS